MAKLTWKKEFNGYEVGLSFICHYKKGYIVEFDSHDMVNNINKVFNNINEDINKKFAKMGFLELSKYLFNKMPNLYSVEFVSKDTRSEYFIEDVKNN